MLPYLRPNIYTISIYITFWIATGKDDGSDPFINTNGFSFIVPIFKHADDTASGYKTASITINTFIVDFYSMYSSKFNKQNISLFFQFFLNIYIT